MASLAARSLVELPAVSSGGCAGGVVWASAGTTASALTAIITVNNLNAFMN